MVKSGLALSFRLDHPRRILLSDVNLETAVAVDSGLLPPCGGGLRWGVRQPRHGTCTALRPRACAKPPYPALPHAWGREAAQRIGRECGLLTRSRCCSRPGPLRRQVALTSDLGAQQLAVLPEEATRRTLASSSPITVGGSTPTTCRRSAATSPCQLATAAQRRLNPERASPAVPTAARRGLRGAGPGVAS